MSEPLRAAAVMSDEIIDAFSAIVGAENVIIDEEGRRPYAHDRLPFANYLARADRLVGTLPSFVLRPADASEVTRVVKEARARKIRLIPYGNGSGVLGGAIPLAGEAMVDMRRLDGIVSIDETNAMVTVRAGMNGMEFEAALQERGLTCGHFPQSIEISTVGGWAACRGAGQASSRYGKIEDIVLGLKAVLPNGEELVVRPVARRSVGPSIRDILVGSEGAFGIITELTLRLWKKPEHEEGVVLAFPSVEAALESARRIMQAELRPSIVRIYDEKESAERTDGIDVFGAKPVLAIMAFSGLPALAERERDLSLAIASELGGEVAPKAPYEAWQQTRYVAYSQKWQAAGYYNDTVEVTGNWSALPAMYEQMRAAVLEIYPEIHFGAHWSHVYPEGACQYMTIRLPPMDQAEALKLHARLWQALLSLTLENGGSIAHHHGVGLFRNPWLKDELGAGLDVLQSLKDALDPDNLFNPGKVGLRPAEGSARISAN